MCVSKTAAIGEPIPLGLGQVALDQLLVRIDNGELSKRGAA
jgi:hypothetical protein